MGRIKTENECASTVDEKKASWFRQEDRQDFVTNRLGKDPWITVYESMPLGRPEGGGYFSALLPNSMVATALETHTWDLMIGNGRPGFIVYGDRRKPPEYQYLEPGEPVPLVLVRSFDSHREGYCELLEEFRLFHNLFHDSKSGKYFRVDENGDEEEIARVAGEKVEVKLRAVRQFCAVKKMHLAVYFELDRFSPLPLQELGLMLDQNHTFANVQSDLLTYEVYAGDYSAGSTEGWKAFCRMIGKRLFPPLPIEQCGLSPYDDPRRFEEFIIGTDDDGNPKTFACDPGKLANYFGKNPGAPNFLTPVFFRRDVLSKYYSNATKYEVQDSHLRCQGSWSLRLDNNHKEYVIVFLGDLGQSLGHKEQLYWKSFNVIPTGTISRTNFRRSFLAEWADAESLDLVFKARFEVFRKRWETAQGWPLFKPLAQDDEHLLKSLHIPVADDQSEFDNQVLALTKTLIDSLNEKELVNGVALLPENARGITKLEMFLAVNGASGFEEQIQFLRALQDLRSSGVGHRKSDAYDKIAKKLGVERGLRVVFEELLAQAVKFIGKLEAWVGSACEG